MEALFLLFVFLIVLSVITVLGHAIWLMCEYVIQSFSSHQSNPSISPTSVITWRCQTCASHVQVGWDFCGNCGTPRNSKTRSIRDLAAMERQLEVFRRDNKIDVAIFQQLCVTIEEERTRLTNPQPVTATTTLRMLIKNQLLYDRLLACRATFSYDRMSASRVTNRTTTG